MKLFLVIIPWDYTTADVEVCYTKKEAEQFIQDSCSRDRAHYALIKEVEVGRAEYRPEPKQKAGAV